MSLINYLQYFAANKERDRLRALEQQKTERQAGINATLRDFSRGVTEGGPLAPERLGAGSYQPVNVRDFTQQEMLPKLAQHGTEGLETYDKLATAMQGAGDAKRLADFRLDTAKAPYTPGGVNSLRQQYPMLTKEASYGGGLPEAPKPETFGQPVQGVGTEGKPGFFRAGSRGTVQPIEGYTPMPKRGMVIETGPDGVTRVRTNAEQGQPQSKGRTAADKEFAKVYVDYKAAGGFADAGKQLGQLKQVAKALASGEGALTGPVIGSTPDSVLKFVNPEAISTREKVEEVVQRNLRLVLGAQFTEKEGERLIARAYNPNLSEKENSQRVLRLYNQMLSAARAKQSASNYFETHGTLTGWKGKLFTTDDFLSEFSGAGGGEQPGGEWDDKPKTADDYLKSLERK
jgi:hypothetical protein